MSRGQCLFQGEFSALGNPLAPRGGETFFIQHCRGQALVRPLLRSCPRRGPEGMLCRCLGSWGWPLHGRQVGLGSVSLVPASLSERRQEPQGRLVFVRCTETCVGALVKNVNGAAPMSGGGGQVPEHGYPECVVVEGHLGYLAQQVNLIRAILVLGTLPLPRLPLALRGSLSLHCFRASGGDEVINPWTQISQVLTRSLRPKGAQGRAQSAWGQGSVEH